MEPLALMTEMQKPREQREVRITVPLTPPSGNELRRKYRHWAVYRELRELWAAELFLNLPPEDSAALRQRTNLLKGRKPECTEVEIHVVHNRARLLDDDNLKAGVKPLLDGLKNLGYIVNDSPRWIQLKVTQERGAKQQTQILLRPRSVGADGKLEVVRA